MDSIRWQSALQNHLHSLNQTSSGSTSRMVPRAADQKSVFERHLGSFAFLVPRWTVVVLIFKMKASFIF
jgi:hypothetical protein